MSWKQMSLCLRTRGPFDVEEAGEKARCSMAGCAYLGTCWPFFQLGQVCGWPASWHLLTMTVWWLQGVFGLSPTLLTATLSLLISPGFFFPARAPRPTSYLLLCQGCL